MRIAVSADERTGVAGAVAGALRERGHEVVAEHGALAAGERAPTGRGRRRRRRGR